MIGRPELRAYLAAQTHDALVDTLLEAADGDTRLYDRLAMAAATGGERATRLATFRASIDSAVATPGFVSWSEMWDYASGIEAAIGGLERLLGEGHADDVVELAEYALSTLEAALQEVDDSSGQVGGLLEDLQELHLKACRRARPERRSLAERLFAWELHGDWDTFSGAAQTYGRVLGKAGRARYRELAEAAWSQVPARVPGGDRGYDGQRRAITRIMESLARDVDQLVDVMSRDLGSGHQFLRIAEAYRAAGRDDDALAWAERGVAAFAESPDRRLVDFLVDEHARRGQHAEATRLMWDAYSRNPGLDAYRKLKQRTEPAGEWDRRRADALELLRAELARRSAERPPPYSSAPPRDRSELVRIFLWEDDHDAAWREACEGGCTPELWLELAERRRREHPEEALEVYRDRVDPTIEYKNNDAYGRATGHVREIQALLCSLGREDEFAVYVADLRARHKRKRNLVKLLDAL